MAGAGEALVTLPHLKTSFYLSLLPGSPILHPSASRRYSFGDIGLAISNNTRQAAANYSQIQGKLAAWLACRF
jgi:hypothetical protein